MRFHHDDRRKFWGDIFSTDQHDINIVRPATGVPIAWHRHQRQDDAIFLVQGALRLRIFGPDPTGRTEWILVDTDERYPLWIGRNKWHGYEALVDDTVILQFNGPSKYDGTDEERHEIGAPPWNW